MTKLFAATAVAALLVASAAQATGPNLPGSVEDFIDYVCNLEDDGDIPPPEGGAQTVFNTAFDAYVEAGLLDAYEVQGYINESCDYCVKTLD